MSDDFAGPVFDRSLRAAHDTEVLLGTFIGTLRYESQHTAPSPYRAAELEHVAALLRAHAVTLASLAERLSPAIETKDAA
ncbi:hypothetical protein C0214_19485 [Methylobacterium sp. DM1]|nr:hypothetical protein C0214_19485 [Methylobacterium sp. DM1]